MRRAVPDHSEVMEEVAHLAGDRALRFQATEKVRLRFFGVLEEAALGRHQLREHFTELPQLDERGVRVVLKVALGQRSKTHELRIVRAQKLKTDRCRCRSHASPQQATV